MSDSDHSAFRIGKIALTTVRDMKSDSIKAKVRTKATNACKRVVDASASAADAGATRYRGMGKGWLSL